MHDWLNKHLWWILGILSLSAIFLVSSIRGPSMPLDWTALIIGFALVAVLANSPIPIGTVEIDLSHSISIVMGLTLGPAPALLALVFGLGVGHFARGFWDPIARRANLSAVRRLRTWVISSSQQVISLSAGLVAYHAIAGPKLPTDGGQIFLGAALALTAAFIGTFLALFWLTRVLSRMPRPSATELATLIVLVIGLPIPYALFTAVAYDTLREPALLVFGGGIAVVAPLVRSVTLSERRFKRKVQELSSLGQVSQVLPASLDLEHLLSAIYAQVETLLHVDNFYVALYHRHEETLSYPLAIKGGSVEQWATRSLSDRLTDRVVLTGEAILIPNHAPQALRSMGMPELDNAPEAWLGVPLVDPSRVIGCLAIFHTLPGQSLSREDKSILETIAGQAAVAIQNAMLYQQTQERAQALATLNQITASMSSTLDPDRAMSLVCNALIRTGGGHQASIHLIDGDRDRMVLASEEGLSDDLTDLCRVVPLSDRSRSEAIQERHPVHFADIELGSLPDELVNQMQIDGIASFTDLPLSTPTGVIGLATVYFPTPREIPSEDLELLETLVSQAALAVANASAHAATDQALQRQVDQLSRLEAIGREMASTLEPDELFKAILNHSLRAAGTTTGYLALFEDQQTRLKVVADQGYAQSPGASPPPRLFEIEDLDTLEKALTGEALDALTLNSGDASLVWRSNQARSVLCAPITRWGRHIGLILVESPQEGAFGSEQERFMAQLAAHAAVAITNASLYQQLESNLLEQSLLYQASVQIANTLEVGSVAMAAADSLAVALGADGASLFRWSPERRDLESLAMVVDGRPNLNPNPRLITEDIAPALVACVSESSTLNLMEDSVRSEADRVYLTELRDARSLLAIPLLIGSQPNGLIEVYKRDPLPYDDNQIRTAQTIASQAAIALENTELFRRIRESQEHILAVLNSTQEGMVMLDEAGRVVVANRQLEPLTGLALDQWVGHEIVGNESDLAERLGFTSAEFQALISPATRGGALTGETTILEHHPPNRRTLERTVSPVVEEDGVLIGWLVVLRDISEAQELSETREQLTEMIVHDLRSPLTTLLGGLKILEDTLSEEQKRAGPAAQALNVSRRSVDQMLGLVNSLLDIAKLESGELPLARESVHLDELLSELVATYVNEANAEGVFLTLESATGNGVQLQADKEKLWRVLINLLDNALKFTPPGGSIDVALQQEDGHVQVSVADTGPGIPEDLRDQIFEPFVQVPGVAGRRRGTGLGLAFAKLAIEAHGGRIWCEAKQGGGTIFKLDLPLQ